MDGGQIVTLYRTREVVAEFRSIDHGSQMKENESLVLTMD